MVIFFCSISVAAIIAWVTAHGWSFALYSRFTFRDFGFHKLRLQTTGDTDGSLQWLVILVINMIVNKNYTLQVLRG